MAEESKRLMVFIADDDVGVREDIGRMVRSLGHFVALFARADQLWAHMRQHRCDAIVSDHEMPGSMTGLALLNKIRADQRFAQMPVMVMSDKHIQDEVGCCGGVAATKPVTTLVCERFLESALKKAA